MNSFDPAVALRTIGSIMKEHGITHAELRAVFPHRPATEAEFSAVGQWLGQVIRERKVGRVTPNDQQVRSINPSRPSAPQFSLPENKDKNGKNRPTYYAVELPGEEGKLRFFRVKAGRKVGIYFVDEQASDDFYSVSPGARRVAILSAIMKDPKAAMVRYGKEIGRCCLCNRTLTSEYRNLGIGPVCIDK